MQRRDYIERLIERVAAALARIAELAGAGDTDGAERELDATWSVVGLRRADVARLDDVTLVALVGPKRPLAAKLLAAEAVIARARGDEGRALSLEARSRGLAER